MLVYYLFFEEGSDLKKRILLLLSAALLMLSSSCTPTAKVTPSQLPVFRLDELPDIGGYSGKEELRFHEKASDTFIPDESYGTLVPFLGRIKEFEGDSFGADVLMTYSTMGLCTSDGQIVVPPFNGYVTYNDYYDEFPYYQLTPYSDEAAEMMMQPDSVVIPADGSWKLDLSAGSWICGAGDGVISVLVSDPETYEFRGLVCYDYDGNKLFEKDGVWSASSFSHGYANINIGQEEKSSCYIDKNGNIVSEMYQYCSYFNDEGVAYVREHDGKGYLIDTDFYRTSDIYQNIYFYSDDYITALGDGFTDVISKDGHILASIYEPKSVSIHGKGNNMLYSYYADRQEVYKWLDGTLFVNENGQMPNTYVQAQGYYSYKDVTDNSQTLFDGTGKILAKLENCEAVTSVIDGGKLIVYTKGSYDFEEFENGRPIYTDPLRTVIYDAENKKELAVIAGQGGVTVVGDDEKYLLLSVYDDYDFGGSTAYYLFDVETREFVFSDCLMIDYYDVGDGYFAVGTDSFCTLYDTEFKKVLRLINE